jgi:hypothetical protein
VAINQETSETWLKYREDEEETFYNQAKNIRLKIEKELIIYHRGKESR